MAHYNRVPQTNILSLRGLIFILLSVPLILATATIIAPAAQARADDSPAATLQAAAVKAHPEGPDVTLYSTDEEAAEYRQLAILQATAEAFAQLYARIDHLMIANQQTVGQLLADKPQLRPLLYDQLGQRARRGEPQVYSDGMIVVQIHLPMEEIARALEQAAQRLRQVQAGLPPAEDLRKIVHHTNRLGIWGYGSSMAAPPGNLLDSPPPGWHQTSVLARLQVRRQAIENAYEQLMISVRQLRLSPSRRLADFIDADQRVATGLHSFIRSHPAAGPVEYLPEGYCRAAVEVPMVHLLTELRALAIAFDHSSAFPPDRFANIRADLPDFTLRAVGLSAPPATIAARPAAEPLLSGAAQAPMPDDVPDPEQARMLAEQGAMSKIIESFREELMKRHVPGNGVELEEYILTHPKAARDVEMIFANVRLVQSTDPAPGMVKVTAEMPIEAAERLLRHYARLAASAPAEENSRGN